MVGKGMWGGLLDGRGTVTGEGEKTTGSMIDCRTKLVFLYSFTGTVDKLFKIYQHAIGREMSGPPLS